MNAESSSDKSIAENESVIVVSDLHLGGEIDHCTKYRFCNFLEAISRFKLGFYLNEAQEVQIGSLTKYLMPPKKIILLGDILEL
jgi:metallophosphoesterase superfamily enzyme